MITIQEVRSKYPQYSDLSDQQLVDSLHGKYYSDIPINEFYQQVGLGKETAPKPELTKAQTALDYAKSAGSGAYKGSSYIPGFPGDIEQLGQQFLPEWMTKPIIKGAKPIQVFPTSAQIRGMAETVVPALEGVAEYEPQTTGGRYLKTGIEFAAPSATGKTAAARKFGAGLGLGGGALYETVESTSGSPGVASAVTIPAMLTAGFLGGPSKAAKLAERSLIGVSEKEISKAIDLENAAKIAGIKLLPGETFKDNKMIAQITEDVLQSDLGSAYIYQAIKNRPKKVEALVEKQADAISKMPESQRAVFKMISDTAKTTVQQAKKTRTNKAQDAGYKVANDQSLPSQDVLDIIDGIDSIGASRNSPSAIKLKSIKEQLIKKKVKDEVTGKITIIPETNINNLSSTYKQFKSEVDASNKELVVGGERFVVQDLRPKLYNADNTGALDLLGSALNTNPAYKAGNEKFAELSNSLVKVVEANVLPLSKKKINLTTIENFVFNPKQASKKDINDTLSTLNKTNPQATIEIANVYFRNAINNSFGINKQGADLKQGFNLVKAIAGKKKERENFLAVIDNVADAQKVSRKDLKVGFENMLNILERTGRISNINKPGFDVKGIAGQTLAKDIAMAKTFNPLVRLATKYSELKANQAFDNLGRIMANPQSTKLLVELGRTNPQSKAAINKTIQAIGLVSPFRDEQAQQPYSFGNLQEAPPQ
jgi:hypothetical protein